MKNGTPKIIAFCVIALARTCESACQNNMLTKNAKAHLCCASDSKWSIRNAWWRSSLHNNKSNKSHNYIALTIKQLSDIEVEQVLGEIWMKYQSFKILNKPLAFKFFASIRLIFDYLSLHNTIIHECAINASNTKCQLQWTRFFRWWMSRSHRWLLRQFLFLKNVEVENLNMVGNSQTMWFLFVVYLSIVLLWLWFSSHLLVGYNISSRIGTPK